MSLTYWNPGFSDLLKQQAAKDRAMQHAKHSADCGWHVDQYSWECDCGVTRPKVNYNCAGLPLSDSESVTGALTPEVERLAEQDRLWALLVSAATT